jgi:hypothetical protein
MKYKAGQLRVCKNNFNIFTNKNFITSPRKIIEKNNIILLLNEMDIGSMYAMMEYEPIITKYGIRYTSQYCINEYTKEM